MPQWPGGHVGCFSVAVLAGSPIPMAPFLVWSSYVRRALRRTQTTLVAKRAAKPASFLICEKLRGEIMRPDLEKVRMHVTLGDILPFSPNTGGDLINHPHL